MTQPTTSMLKKRFIDSLRKSEVIETDQKKMPPWATDQGFFMRFHRAMGTARRMRDFVDPLYQAMRLTVEEPDFVFGPSYKGTPLATLMSLQETIFGQGRTVYIGFDLPGGPRIAVQDVVSQCAEDVKPFMRIWVPKMFNSRELNDWASDTAKTLTGMYKSVDDKPEKLGFNTVLADCSAVPAATALTYHLGGYTNIDPDFAIPRRTENSRRRAEATYKEMKRFYLDSSGFPPEKAEDLAREDMMERLVVGRVQDHARYLWVSPQEDEVFGDKPRLFSGLDYAPKTVDGKKYRTVMVDDSVLTGETMRSWAEGLKITYPNAEIMAGFAAVHFQLVPPNSRNLGRNLRDIRDELSKHVPVLKAVLDSDDIIEYLHDRKDISEDVYLKYKSARQRYGTGWKVGVL